jgi:hypothetical protein
MTKYPGVRLQGQFKFMERKSKRKVRRPLTEVQPQTQRVQTVQPEHSTPHQTAVTSGSLTAEKHITKQLQTTSSFGFDEIDCSLPEPAVTPIGREGGLGEEVSVSPTAMCTLLDSPARHEKLGGKVRSYLVKSAFKREDPLARKRRNPGKKAKRRLLGGKKEVGC